MVNLPPAAARQAKALPWLHDAEPRAVSWIIENKLADYLDRVQQRRAKELAKQRQLVQARLEGERDRLAVEAMAASEEEYLGEKPRESSGSLTSKATDLQARLDQRLELIDRQSTMATKPPLVVAAALILPVGMLEDDLPEKTPLRA